MRRSSVIAKRLLLCAGACCAALLLWPADAAAQRRGRPVVVRPRTSVVVGVGFGSYYRPFYRPYYYSPLFYNGFYDPVYVGWEPWYAQYPYPVGYRYYGNWASARIEVKPRDAQVYIDGYFVGVVDQFDGVLQRLDVPPGEHELTVYMPGYRSYHEMTLFRPGEGYHFRAILEPLPAGAPPEPKPQPDPNRRLPDREPHAPGP